MNPSFVKILKGAQGLALFMVIFVMAFFLLFVTGGLIFSQLELKKTSYSKLATQAIEVADAGLQHALAAIAWEWNFNGPLNGGTPPGTVVSNMAFPSAGSGFSYTVSARNDDADINNGGSSTNDTNYILILNSTAYGPNGTKKEVQAYVKRSLASFTPPGALYFPANSAAINFNGDDFFITGNDTAYNGSPASDPKAAIAGIAPIYDAIRDSFKSALGSGKYDLVQGAGYSAGPPITPSVITTSNILDINQIALKLYNNTGAVKFLDGLDVKKNACPSSIPLPPPNPISCIVIDGKSAVTLGTDSAPQMIYIRESANDHVHLDGNVTGSGVLVIEGKAHIYGDFNFHGVLVKVDIQLTGGQASGTDDPEALFLKDKAKLFGALLVGPTNGFQSFKMRDDAKIYYSSQALTMVNNLCGSCLPQPARVFAWLDK